MTEPQQISPGRCQVRCAAAVVWVACRACWRLTPARARFGLWRPCSVDLNRLAGPLGLGDRRRDRQDDPVTGDDPTVEQHHFARRMRGHRLRNAADRDREKGGNTADRDAIIRDTEGRAPAALTRSNAVST